MRVYIGAGCDASYFSKVCDNRVDETHPEINGNDVSAIFHKYCEGSQSGKHEYVDPAWVCFKKVVDKHELACNPPIEQLMSAE